MPLDVAHPTVTRPAGHDRALHRSSGTFALGAAALALGGLALWVRLAAWRAERQHPPIGRFITVDGVRLHYIERGAGRPIVLIHGMGSLLQDFTSSIVDDLAQDYRVVAFDRPGYGYSRRPRGTVWTPERQARLFHMALTRLGIEKPIVLGHSWGTLVALAYALAYPHQTAAIVLLGGYVFPVRRRELSMTGFFRLPLFGALLRETIAPLVSRLTAPRLLETVFAPNPIPPRFAAEFPGDLNHRPSQLRALAEDALLLRPSAAALSRRYRDVLVPTVIVAGESDHLVDPHRQAIRLHHAIPHSAIRLLPRTGHMVHHARPSAVHDAVAVAREQAETAS